MEIKRVKMGRILMTVLVVSSIVIDNSAAFRPVPGLYETPQQALRYVTWRGLVEGWKPCVHVSLPKPMALFCLMGECDRSTSSSPYCQCYSSFSGKTCSTYVGKCTETVCGEHLCKDSPTTRLGYTCVCKPGFRPPAVSSFNDCIVDDEMSPVVIDSKRAPQMETNRQLRSDLDNPRPLDIAPILKKPNNELPANKEVICTSGENVVCFVRARPELENSKISQRIQRLLDSFLARYGDQSYNVNDNDVNPMNNNYNIKSDVIQASDRNPGDQQLAPLPSELRHKSSARSGLRNQNAVLDNIKKAPRHVGFLGPGAHMLRYGVHNIQKNKVPLRKEPRSASRFVRPKSIDQKNADDILDNIQGQLKERILSEKDTILPKLHVKMLKSRRHSLPNGANIRRYPRMDSGQNDASASEEPVQNLQPLGRLSANAGGGGKSLLFNVSLIDRKTGKVKTAWYRMPLNGEKAVALSWQLLE